MRASKFLKDFFSTGFSQAGVLIFSLVLLKLMADAFSESHFGLFNLVRRWNLILIPVITLNLSIGLVRYVSYEKEKSSFFLHLSLVTSAALCLPVFSALILFPSVFSKLLFDTPGHGRLVMALALFLTANIMHLMAYSYLRGKLEMNAANLLRTLFFGVPLLPAAAILLFKKETAFAPVSHLYLFFLAYAVWGIFISGYYLGKEFSGSAVTAIFKNGRSSVSDALKQGRDIFRFSLSRIPAVFFIAMVFGFPVLYAGYRLSLKAAGYVGIVVSILRLFEIFSMPFNMIFLPKFSALKRGNDPQLIRDHCRVVVDFIFTFLPFCGVFIFGLLHFAVRAWFPPSYLAAVDSIAVTVLFSAFYLAYALVRGILDGLFEFPYTNIICFSGFSIIALTALVFGSTTFTISIAFGCGLFTLGIVSVGTLVRKLQLSIRWLSLSKSLALATLVFFLLYYADGQLTGSGMKGLQSFAVSLSYRVLLLGALWGLYWRKTLWYNEVLKRLRVPKTVND